MNNLWKVGLLVVLATLFTGRSWGEESAFKGAKYNMGKLKPFDSELKVKSGQVAPDFALPSLSGKKVRLSQFHGKNVVLSFVPAAWTHM